VQFPSLKRIELRSFSLYRNRPELSLDLDLPVFCLAGANGLGKSTFLNAVTYGLTGVVPNPEDRFDSIDEHYRHNIPYAKRYFEGRIDEVDREAAEISLRFTVGPKTYSITRGMFDPEGLRALHVTDGARDIVAPKPKISDGARHDRYVKQLVADVGLASFSQYVFLQHFVFSFDERRRLLFWEDTLVAQALYLAFGITGKDAEDADTWRRQAERFDSQARNLQYQATTARKRLADLRATENPDRSDGRDSDPALDYERLLAERKSANEESRRATTSVEDATLELQRAKAEELSARNTYEEAFAEHLNLLASPADHPLVRATIEQARCGLCGTEGAEVERAVNRKLSDDTCPLCDSPIRKLGTEQKKALKRAKELGKRLEKFERASSQRRTALRRLEKEADQARRVATAAATAVSAFEAENDNLPDLPVAAGTAVAELKKRLESEIEDATARRDDYRAQREDRRKKLRRVQATLSRNYREVEGDFLPLFTELAQSFLGLDVELTLKVKPNTIVALDLEVEGTHRQDFDQLSESQRYFVDIALRMALTRQMVGEDGNATLYIDTPEGSLDVAYESRAGLMFAQYVEDSNRIVMTANLNASQLLRELARDCGHASMEVVRMIDWSDLSDVQAESEELFETAYAAIEEELSKAPPE
jgi:hypothetical protein